MANKKIFWGLGIAAFVFAAYRTINFKASVAFFQYSLGGLKFRMKGLTPEIIFNIQVYNPNQTSIPITSFFGVIKKGEQILANFENLNPVTIGEKATSSIDVSCRIKLLSVILNIVRGQSLGLLTVEGMLKTTLFEMPVKKDVSLSSLAGTQEIGRLTRKMNSRFPVRMRPVKMQSGFLQYSNI